MSSLGDLTLRDAGRLLARYQPFLLTVAAIVLIATLLPGAPAEEEETIEGPVAQQQQQQTASDPGVVESPDGPTQTGGVDPGANAAQDADTAAAPEEQAGPTADVQEAAPATAVGDPLEAPDCDREAGRLTVPYTRGSNALFAPSCVPIWPEDADNHGTTYRGVTEDTITVVRYRPQEDEQVNVMLQAAGVEGSDEEERKRNAHKVMEAFEAHYETYGRRVEWIEMRGSGPTDDDAAARADAIKVAEEHEAFASISGPAMQGGGNAYMDELAARGVMCIMCIPSQPHHHFQRWAPHSFTHEMTTNLAYIHLAEMLAKRVGQPGLAEHAGDPVFQQQERVFGHIQYNTEDGAYTGINDFLDQQLRQWGLGGVEAVVEYDFDFSRSQEHARTSIARMQEAGVTSVICLCDPLFPVFFTNEATRQGYFPEWIMSIGYLMDLNLFGRTYDQVQWQNAFGLGAVPVRLNQDAGDPLEDNLVAWHYGEELDSYPDYSQFAFLYTGVHMAGPNLTPQTFQEGMFALEPASGYKTHRGFSFGHHGRTDWPKYAGMSDLALLWWDPEATGPDELGNYGRGMYQYLDGGTRTALGDWPESPAPFFEREGAVTMHDEVPESDRLPVYTPREPLREPSHPREHPE